MKRRRIRGSYRLLNAAQHLGLLNGCVDYRLSPQVVFHVPLHRRENRWSIEDVLCYERQLVDAVIERLREAPAPVRFLDCGADIGVISALLASRLDGLAEVLAFEPNPEAYEVLVENVASLGIKGTAYNCAVSNFRGKGVFRSDPRDRSAHAQFIVPVDPPVGEFDVLRIDDIGLSRQGTTCIKIDVEGEELNVLAGAERTLMETQNFVIAYESHAEVCTRTGIDPCEILRWIGERRSIECVVAEHRSTVLDVNCPFFNQIPSKIANVVCWSIEPARG